MAAILKLKIHPPIQGIQLGNIDFRIQHTQIRLKSHVPNFYSKIPIWSLFELVSEILPSLHPINTFSLHI